MKQNLSIIGTFLILLSGCMVGPNYKAPENTISDQWNSSSIIQGVVSNDQPVTDWWEIFHDPLLTKYIKQSAEHNKDVLMAESNILEARAMKQVAASSLFPQLFADLNATKTYFSKNGPVFSIGPAATGSQTGPVTGSVSPTTGLPFTVQTPQIQNLFNALFDASWEIDLFGKTRRNVEAAKATIEQRIEQKNDVLLSVMAEIAKNYMDLRSYQQQALLIEENITLLQQEALIIQKQLETGYASQLDYENIQAQLENEKALLPDIHAQIYRDIYTISVLTGNNPETLLEELAIVQPLPEIPDQITVGIRSDLLRRRPDIRSSERALAAATANIGVAVASFFPTITIGADGGFQSLQIKKLFNAASKTWDIGGDINTPVFQGGLLLGNLRAARAVASVAFYSYEQTVLRALEESESSIIAYKEDLETSRCLSQAKKSNQNLVMLNTQRYEKGLIGLLDLLDSKRKLNQAELNLLNSNRSSLVDLITLYKALGGGWESLQKGE